MLDARSRRRKSTKSKQAYNHCADEEDQVPVKHKSLISRKRRIAADQITDVITDLSLQKANESHESVDYTFPLGLRPERVSLPLSGQFLVRLELYWSD